MEYTEGEIIVLLRKGDNRIFEWLFKSYYASLKIYAHRLVGEPDTAEEIVAAVFTVIWEKKEEIVFGSSVKGYLFRAVHNRCINHLKRLQIRKRYERHLLERLAEYSEEASAEWELGAEDLQKAIMAALDELPSKCREIFLLSRFGHKKYQEIASMLDVSTKTVETQMSIALRKLRKSLRHWTTVWLLFPIKF